MSPSYKPVAGAPMPVFSTAKVGGGELSIGSAAGWQAVFVYRGKHCPLCRKYLGELNGQLDAFTALGLEVAAVSADPREKAEAEAAEEGWRFPVGYELSMERMRALGVYISQPRSPDGTDRPFAEPGRSWSTPSIACRSSMCRTPPPRGRRCSSCCSDCSSR